jgi:hypothetical protein
MMEHILSRDNVTAALKRVEANKGSHGVDGMSVQTYRTRNLRTESSPAGRNPETERWDTVIRHTYRDRPLHPTGNGIEPSMRTTVFRTQLRRTGWMDAQATEDVYVEAVEESPNKSEEASVP